MRNSKPNDVAAKIKVLVCTANMGNEQPDVDSLNAWIPKDGDTSVVLNDQPYPIRENAKAKLQAAVQTLLAHPAAPNGDIDTTGTDDDEPVAVAEQFDIIAIGMQEATFEVETGEKQTKIAKNVKKLTSQVTDLTSTSDYQKTDNNIAVAGIRKINSIFRGEKEKQSDLSSPNIKTSIQSLNVISERKTEEVKSNRGDEDTRVLHQMLQEQLPSYTRAVSYQRGQMRLMIFYNEPEISVDVLSVKAQNTGKAGLANKGGIVAECDVNHGTRVSFLTAHLEAHEGESKYKTRCSTIGDIFREHIDRTHTLVEQKDWNAINEHDELAMAVRNNDCLAGFKTPKCHFPPTFKVHRMDGYTYNEKRSPSYTDRVLYKKNHLLDGKIRPLAYEGIDSFTSSDHKPVRLAAEMELNPTQRWRPVLVKTHHSFRASQRRGQKLRGSTFGKRDSPSLPKRENLHLFISSIECSIASDKYVDVAPSTYVSFVSTPRDAVKKDVSRREKLRNLFGISSTKTIGKDNKTRVQMGWPRTKNAKHTCDPQWEDEVHFKVRTHDDNGRPTDLTGALLHVLLSEVKDTNSHLIGSFTFNLAFLVAVSRKDKNKSISHTPKQEKQSKMASLVINQLFNLVRGPDASAKENGAPQKDDGHNGANRDKPTLTSDATFPQTEGEEVTLMESLASAMQLENSASAEAEAAAASAEFSSNGPSKALRTAYRGSIFASSAQKATQNVLKKSIESAADVSSTLDSLGIHSMNIDEPLMKNGLEVGRIKFTIDAWWLDSSKATYTGNPRSRRHQ
ncbi:MAG: hypothetical protein SGILL_008977 [Bacillariaceae sp.]